MNCRLQKLAANLTKTENYLILFEMGDYGVLKDNKSHLAMKKKVKK